MLFLPGEHVDGDPPLDIMEIPDFEDKVESLLRTAIEFTNIAL